MLLLDVDSKAVRFSFLQRSKKWFHSMYAYRNPSFQIGTGRNGAKNIFRVSYFSYHISCFNCALCSKRVKRKTQSKMWNGQIHQLNNRFFFEGAGPLMKLPKVFEKLYGLSKVFFRVFAVPDESFISPGYTHCCKLLMNGTNLVTWELQEEQKTARVKGRCEAKPLNIHEVKSKKWLRSIPKSKKGRIRTRKYRTPTTW